MVALIENAHFEAEPSRRARRNSRIDLLKVISLCGIFGGASAVATAEYFPPITDQKQLIEANYPDAPLPPMPDLSYLRHHHER